MIHFKALGGEGSRTCFLRLGPLTSRKGFMREDSERVSRRGYGWTALDVISFVIGWPAFGNTRNRNSRQPVFRDRKFLRFLGRRADESIGQITKDVAAFRILSLVKLSFQAEIPGSLSAASQSLTCLRRICFPR